MEYKLTYAEEQYGFICDARAILLNYCKTISRPDFLKENSSFGQGGSIRNLLVHIANTYEFWIGKCAFNNQLFRLLLYGYYRHRDPLSQPMAIKYTSNNQASFQFYT